MQLELLNFPVDRFQRALQHAAAVQRELDVLRVEGARAGRLPRRSDEIIADLDARFTGYRATMDMLDGLVAQGTTHADVQIPDPNISRRHAELRQEGATWWLVDLDSTNGIEVRGKRVKRLKLENGTRFTIGSTELVFRLEDREG